MDLRVLVFFAAALWRYVHGATTCAAATTSALCTAATCDGYWDSSVSTCTDCTLSQTNCESVCSRRWILGSCVAKCTNAFTSTACTACYGKWNGSACYDCMQDQSNCVDICSRYWVVDKCWDCAASSTACTDASTCIGSWDSTVPTCDVCWTDQSACEGCNRYWDTLTSTCINCQADQTTCETASACNGYWNSGTSFCTLCNLSKTNCQGTLCGGTWDSITNTCTNCDNDSRQCTLCLKDWLFSKCVNCDSGFNTCTSISYCNGVWDGSACTICNQDSATCTATGSGACNGSWVSGTSSCYRCDQNLTECSKCQLDWIPGIANTCVDCNQSSTYCTNTAICNGVWSTTTNTCQICNADSDTCVACTGLRYWSASNLCINCYENATKCASCGYFWVPSNSNYDSSLQGTCVNCSVSEDVCTSKTKCNGFWNASSSTCTAGCNQSSSICTGSCSGTWDSTNKLCNVCSKTQAECTICNKQWVVGTCTNCMGTSAACKSTNCNGIWTSSTSTCLVCNLNSTNCKSCGGFWKNSKCNFCDNDQITCSQCGGFYDSDTSQCTLLNDEYTCEKGLVSSYESPYWNGLRCFNCEESWYVCNKECFRVWTNESCSTTSCSLDQYTCESLCHQQWNYSLKKCFHIDINNSHVCFVENDGVYLDGTCIECHASQDLCTVQCNQAYSGTAGTRTWTNEKCTNCQADSTTCTSICQMDWITVTVSGVSSSVCMKCSADEKSCAICQGYWDSTNLVCTSVQSYCNTSATVCANQCAFEPTISFFYNTNISKCLYCDLNQFTCETACASLWLTNLQRCEVLVTQDECQLNNRGVWNTSTSSCQLCNASSTACLACKSDNTWDSTTGTCLNINLGQQYCDIKGDNYAWITDTMSATYGISLVNGRCLSCNTSKNVCENACSRSWSTSLGVCLTCDYSQTVCESSCLKNWISSSSTCVLCNTSSTICTDTCGWYWDSTTSTCINCDTSQTVCENTSKCNGSWNGTTCNLCNASQSNCENKCYFVYSTSTSTCINCQSSKTLCEQSCGYVWNSSLSSNKCVLCNQSKAICEATGTYQCNGFWLATSKCTSIKCNQDKATCVNKCLMNWNSKLSVCQKCTETQYLNSSNVCVECSTLTTSTSCATNCAYTQFFWDSTLSTCRACTTSEYWNGSACVACSTIHSKCATCKLVSSVATCLTCNANYRVVSASVCDCITDRMPNASSVCTLCSTLIANCAECSVLGVCSVCNSGYNWDTVTLTCLAEFTFSANTLTGVAFVTDFEIVLSYPNAAVAAGTTITYAVYFYDTEAAYLAELTNFLVPTISVGVLYQTSLVANTTYTLKLKTGNPVLVPLLILNGDVVPPQDQYLVFTVTKQFDFLDQYSKYANYLKDILTPKDFYYKMLADELVDQYYENACSNCPSGVSCITNTNQCDCSTVITSAGTEKTLYDCSGLDETEYNELVTSLFKYFSTTASTDAQSLAEVQTLLPLLNTADNDDMTVDIFMYYTSQIPVLVAANTSPTAADILEYDDIIKKVISYTNLMQKNSLATTASQLYLPHDRLLTTIQAVMSTQSTYIFQSLAYMRFSSASMGVVSNLITTIDIKSLMDGTSTQLFVSSSGLSSSATLKASRFFYKQDPFFVGNSTFKSYKNYPYIEYFVESTSGTSLVRTNVVFTFIFNVTEVKKSTKCVQRETNGQLQLCSSTSLDYTNYKVTCVCTNSATLIEKIILVEPASAGDDGANYLLYIILACALGLTLTMFLVFIFFYLKKVKDDDKYKILKKQRNGQRQVDPNMSLDDYDLSMEENDDEVQKPQQQEQEPDNNNDNDDDDDDE